MQADEIQYDTYLNGGFTEIRCIRSFGPWKVLAATHGPAPVLLLINDEARSAALCVYYTRDERDRDAAWVSELPPDDSAGAGIAALLSPTPPTRSPGAAKSLPDSKDES